MFHTSIHSGTRAGTETVTKREVVFGRIRYRAGARLHGTESVRYNLRADGESPWFWNSL